MARVKAIALQDYSVYGCPRCEHDHHERLEAICKWLGTLSQEDREFYEKFGLQVICKGCGCLFLVVIGEKQPKVRFAFQTGRLYCPRVKPHPKRIVWERNWQDFCAESFL